MTNRGRVSLPARFAACMAACLLIGTALAIMGALAVWALRLMVAGALSLVVLVAGGAA